MINYKKHLYILMLFASGMAWAQTGINTTSPDPSSALDIYATDRGILLPQYTLGSLTDAVNPVNAPATGSLIYNVGGVNRKGYYYWSGTMWNQLIIVDQIDQVMKINLAAFTPYKTTLYQIPAGVTGANRVNFPSSYTSVINTIVGASFTSGTNINLPAGTYRVDITYDCASPESTSYTGFDPNGYYNLYILNAGLTNTSNTYLTDVKVCSIIANWGGTSIQGYKFSYILKLPSAQAVQLVLNHNDGSSNTSATRDNQGGLTLTFYKFQ